MQESTVDRDAATEALAAFSLQFGEAALELCATAAERMAEDPDVAARVSCRHASLAAQYVELGATDTVESARAAGCRAMLVVLLLESGRRFFAG